MAKIDGIIADIKSLFDELDDLDSVVEASDLLDYTIGEINDMVSRRIEREERMAELEAELHDLILRDAYPITDMNPIKEEVARLAKEIVKIVADVESPLYAGRSKKPIEEIHIFSDPAAPEKDSTALKMSVNAAKGSDDEETLRRWIKSLR